MRDIIMLYVLRYGVEDVLTAVADGIMLAVASHNNGLTAKGKRIYGDAATAIYIARNTAREKTR